MIYFMKSFIYLFILALLLGTGVYLGMRPNILQSGLFSGQVDGRDLASSQIQLEKNFPMAGLKDENGLVSLVTDIGGTSLCSAVGNIYKYKAVLKAEGINVSGEPVTLSFSGGCDRNKMVIFEKSLCNMEIEQLNIGSDVLNGYFIKAKNLLVPMKGLTFFLWGLTVVYRNGAEEEVDLFESRSKLSFSCP